MRAILCHPNVLSLKLPCWTFSAFNCSTSALQSTQELKEEPIGQVDQNKEFIANSHLSPEDYNRYHKIATPLSEIETAVAPLRSVRELYGKYGTASGVDLKYLWPSKQEIQLMKEYEQVKYPLSLPQMIEKVKKDKQDTAIFIKNRQREVHENLKNLDKWKKAVTDGIKKKQKEAQAAKEKREKLLEEVRLMFGVYIDPQSERFQEAVAKKELEEKKAEKALKKQLKQQKMLEQLKSIADAERAKKAAAEKDSLQSTETPPSKDEPNS